MDNDFRRGSDKPRKRPGQHKSSALDSIKNNHYDDELRALLMSLDHKELAHELLDNVTQMLFALTVLTEGLMQTKDVARVRAYLGDVHRISRGALSELNNLLIELHMGDMPRINLSILLQQLASAVAGRSGFAVHTTIESPQGLPYDTQLAFYRIARSALDNVVDHAHADNVTIKLEAGSDRVSMKIIDDGQGFDHQKAGDEGGISGMKSYAAMTGIDLKIASTDGRGTRVEAVWQP